jgi:hypothetical protein
MGRHKRQSGGQPGNQNARKHGFYAVNLTPAELSDYWQLVRVHGLSPQLALTRVKISHALAYMGQKKSPFVKGGDRGFSRRILTESTNMLTELFSQDLDADSGDGAILKELTGALLQASQKGGARCTKRVALKIQKALENL